jgi:hypothetical protein
MEENRSQVEEALARLAEAQAHTEAALQELARRCESLVCDIEEIAYIVLYDVLKHGLGWEVGVLEPPGSRGIRRLFCVSSTPGGTSAPAGAGDSIALLLWPLRLRC